MKYLSALLVLMMSFNADANRPARRGETDLNETGRSTTVSSTLVRNVKTEASRILDQDVDIKVPERLSSTEVARYETDIRNFETALKSKETELQENSLLRSQLATYLNSLGATHPVRTAHKEYFESNENARSQEVKDSAKNAKDVVEMVDHAFYLATLFLNKEASSSMGLEQAMRVYTEIANSKRVDITMEDVNTLELAVARIFNGEFTLAQASRCK